ncbi:oligoendopeptidase F [Bacteroidota bacterium]
MKRKSKIWLSWPGRDSKQLMIFSLVFLFISNPVIQSQDRSTIDDKYKWDLTVIYKTVDDWQADHEAIAKRVETVADYKGELGRSAEDLYNGLRTYFDVLKDYLELRVYSSLKKDEDLNISNNQELFQQARAIGSRLSELSSYMEPEILTIDSKKIEQFFSEKKELNEFKFYVDNIQRLKAHTLSAPEEEILANAGQLTQVTSDVYNIFNNAEKPNPVVKLSSGEDVELFASNYVKYRGVQNREDRAKVMKAEFEGYKQFQNTLGANLAGKLKSDWFFAKSRKYDTTLEYALDAEAIPTTIYTNLIKQINENLPTLHRFLDLKKRMLGVDTLHYYDLYAPIVKSVEMNFPVEESKHILMEVFQPLGEDYVSIVEKAYDDRWIDFYPNTGKRSGAYSTGGLYDVHPFMLMNWTDDYDAISTMAHEMGHALHSYIANENQPFATADYSLFVAEIASTVNEHLLNDYLLKHTKSDEEKLFLLGSYLELLRGTIFRQVAFAEFELAVHTKIEKNEPLTGETMSEIYYDIVKKYYGHDSGHCVVDDYIAYEWAYIHHFLNYTYYVFEYSTSLIYATAFGEKILSEGEPAVESLMQIYKTGGSEHPVVNIRKAGLDPESDEAFNLTMKKMNAVIDQMEEILDK